MLLLTIFSGIGVLAIILAFFIGDLDKDVIPKLYIGVILLLVIFTITLNLELKAEEKLEVTEKIIITDYLEINAYTTLKFEEPTEIKIIEHNYPGYSLLNDDKTIYEVMK